MEVPTAGDVTFVLPACQSKSALSRFVQEKFPDERPLVIQHGDVLFEETLWPPAFIQRMTVARKPTVPETDN